MIKRIITVVAFAALAGCVSNSGIVPDGPDGYHIAARGRTGFSSSGKMQEKNYKQAAEFCAQKGKVMQTMAADSKQARAFGGWPDATLHFRCVTRTE